MREYPELSTPTPQETRLVRFVLCRSSIGDEPVSATDAAPFVLPDAQVICQGGYCVGCSDGQKACIDSDRWVECQQGTGSWSAPHSCEASFPGTRCSLLRGALSDYSQ